MVMGRESGHTGRAFLSEKTWYNQLVPLKGKEKGFAAPAKPEP